MDYIEIIKWVTIIVLGGVIYYLRTYTNVLDKVAEFIAMAEKEYEAYSGAGEQKMQFCIQQINNLLPKAIKVVLTDEILRSIVQNVFDQIKIYSDIQKQKLADKINEKIN